MAKKKLFKYSEIKAAIRYILETTCGENIESNDDPMVIEAADTLIEELGLDDSIDFDKDDKEQSDEVEELDF